VIFEAAVEAGVRLYPGQVLDVYIESAGSRKPGPA